MTFDLHSLNPDGASLNEHEPSWPHLAITPGKLSRQSVGFANKFIVSGVEF